MSQLRLALILDAIDNSGPAFANFEKHAREVTEGVKKRFEAIGEIPEKFARTVGGLGLGIGVGLEFKEAVEDAERFERIGAAADLSKKQVEDFQKTIYDTAADARVSSTELLGAWDEGARKSGGTLDMFKENAATIAREIQLLGPGSGPMVGDIFGSLQNNGVTSAEAVSEAFATMNRHIFESRLALTQSVPALNQFLAGYNQMGHTGTKAFGDLNAVLSTIALTAKRPREAVGDMTSLMEFLEGTGADDDLAQVGIKARGTYGKRDTTRALPDILRELASKTGDPGMERMMSKKLGDGLFLALLPMLNDIRLHGKDSVLEQRLALVGDPERDKETAKDLADSPAANLAAFQDAIKKLGTAIIDVSKPLWTLIGEHSQLTATVATALAGITALGWGWKILSGGLRMVGSVVGFTSRIFGELAMWTGVRLVGSLPRLSTALFDIGAAFTTGPLRGAWALLRAIPLLGTAIEWVAGVFVMLGEVILATPVGWIIAGIAAIGTGAYLLYDHWSGFKRWWHDMWSGATDDVDSTFKAVDEHNKQSGIGQKEAAQGFGANDNDKHAIWMRAHGFGTTDSGHANQLVAGFNNLFTKPGTAEQERRQREAFDFFTGKGWSAQAAAGIAANIGKESTFNERAFGDKGLAYGLAQWHFDRADAIAAHFGKPLDKMSFTEQLAAMDWELHGPEKKAGDHLAAAQNAYDAGAIVSSEYERPKLKEREAATRGSAAEQLMRAMMPGAGSGTQRVSIKASGFPPQTKITAENHDGDVDLGLGHHMVPAQ